MTFVVVHNLKAPTQLTTQKSEKFNIKSLLSLNLNPNTAAAGARGKAARMALACAQDLTDSGIDAGGVIWAEKVVLPDGNSQWWCHIENGDGEDLWVL